MSHAGTMTSTDHHHGLVTTFPVEVEIPAKGDEPAETVEVEAWLCTCGEVGPGGWDGHHHHQFVSLDPEMIKEDLYRTSIMIYRTVQQDDGRPYHGFVKRARDRRKAWRKQTYARHLA